MIISKTRQKRLAEQKEVKELLAVLKENNFSSAKDLMAAIGHVSDLEEQLSSAVQELTAMRQELQEMIDTIEHNSSDTVSNDSRMLISISNVLDIVQSDKFTMQEKNAALKSIVDQITYDKKTNHIDVDYYLIETPEAL